MSTEAKTLKHEQVENKPVERRKDWSDHVQRTKVSNGEYEKLEKAFAKDSKPSTALRSAFARHRR